MERVTVEEAQKLLGNNFIGWEELKPLLKKMGLVCDNIQIPFIGYSYSELQKYSNDYILILGIPKLDNVELSILTFRNCFGINPKNYEPCFYNQDWYLKEDFIYETLDLRWYLLKKNVFENSRAVLPSDLLQKKIVFPSAILCVYTFFAYYYARGEMLWYHDFIWCSNTDHNGDRIYVGKYHDIDGINNNGFSLHRYLLLRACYASICLI